MFILIHDYQTHKSSVAASSSKRNEGTLESANRKKPRKSEAESPPLEICGIDEARATKKRRACFFTQGNKLTTNNST